MRPTSVDPAAVHRALSSPTRQRLLTALRDPEGPRGVEDLAHRLDLHRNTVRAHLAILETADLVRSEPEERGGPGRPRLVYRATSDPEPTGVGYRWLAGVLAGYVASATADPAAEAERLGRAWGRHLIASPPPSHPPAPAEAVDEVVALLVGLGFQPEVGAADTAPRLLLRHCPFLEVAEAHQDVVCSIHLGLMRGALAELTAGARVEDLVPFAEPGLCVSHLTVDA